MALLKKNSKINTISISIRNMLKVNGTHYSVIVQTFQLKVKSIFLKAAFYLLPLEDNQVVLQYLPCHPEILTTVLFSKSTYSS